MIWQGTKVGICILVSIMAPFGSVENNKILFLVEIISFVVTRHVLKILCLIEFTTTNGEIIRQNPIIPLILFKNLNLGITIIIMLEKIVCEAVMRLM